MAKKFFNVEMLPAKHGDALLVEYGATRTRRLLIDGGPLGAWDQVEKRLSAIPAGDQSVELLVVTHVDTDHIEGIIRLLAMPEQDWPIHVEEVWFNGWRHIEEADTLGGREGEFMSALIHHRLGERWNTSFDGNAVLCGEAEDEQIEMEGGMKLTIVSPSAEALAALRDDWAAKLTTATWEMDPGDLEAAWEKLVETNKFHPDSELTLGPDDLTDELRKLLGQIGEVALHHDDRVAPGVPGTANHLAEACFERPGVSRPRLPANYRQRQNFLVRLQRLRGRVGAGVVVHQDLVFPGILLEYRPDPPEQDSDGLGFVVSRDADV